MPFSWQEVERIFHEALERPASERQAFLQACCEDLEVMREVQSLLLHHGEPTGRLAAPIQPLAADLLISSGEDENPPSMLGPYQIDRKLGRGGMGAVYLATDTRLGRKVAIKLVRGSITLTPEAKGRFLSEAQSAASLAHPNIAIIHDFGETAGRPWLVMEYLAGSSLRSKIQAGPINETLWMDYATQLASALEHAHTRRIVHRDIKPENIMLNEDGILKLVDFGLARIVHDEAPANRITETGPFLGTLAYVAPELFSAEEATTRSDVYSYGVVLWELAYGRHPFGNLSGPALLNAVLAGRRQASADPPKAISANKLAFIERCMMRDPSHRYPDGASLCSALRTIRTEGLVSSTTTHSATIAILDFVGLGTDGDSDWLGTGLAETLSVELTKIKSVTVAHRGRVQQVVRRAGQPSADAVDIVWLGRELAVAWIVSGTFQQLGQRIRLTARLIDAATGEVTAVDKFDGIRDDFFHLQDRVAAALIHHLTLRLGTGPDGEVSTPKARNLISYEHYARGRQQMYQMAGPALTASIEHFEQAVALDPEYALAFSALGTAYALQFLRTTNVEDVARASGYLERAIKLDPELGEPYPWLCNIRVRQNNPDGSLAAGAKGIQLQPDLPDAHYFYGGAQYMLSERPNTDLQQALRSLMEAIRLQPKFHPAWIVSGAVSLFLGAHENAIHILNEAIRLEQDPDLQYRFEGARTLLGTAHTRLGDGAKASRYHNEALQKLTGSDHIYRDTFRILSACGLGDIELRRENYEAALSHYNLAWQIAKEKPRIAGNARLQIRASAGLAAAYARTGARDRALELVADSVQRLEAVAVQFSTVTFECGISQLCLDLALAELQLGNRERASTLLARARQAGWKDTSWLRADPLWKPLHNDPVFLSWLGPMASSTGA